MTINEIRQDGVLISTEEIADVPLLPYEIFNNLSSENAQAIIDLATGLLNRAGEVWDNTYAMPVDAPGKEALRPIAEAVLEAALPLIS